MNSLSIGHKELKLKTFVVALIAASAIFLPQIFLNNGYFFYMGDYSSQQVPFYTLCRNAVSNGSWGWNWNTDLGCNYIGSYSYYTLGSPFFWITTLFPNSWTPFLVAPLLALKIACAALTGYLYIRRYTKTPESAMIGGFLYAFSGWSLYNIFFNQFHEALVFFPLVIYALDELVEKRKSGLLACSVFLCAISNYYFLVEIALFIIIYFVVRTALKSWKMTIKKFIQIAAESILGVLMSAILFLPSIFAVTQVSKVSWLINGWNILCYKSVDYFRILYSMLFVPDIPGKPTLLIDSNLDFSSLSAWLPVFGIFGVVAYCFTYKKTWLTKLLVVSGVILFIPVFCSCFNMLNINIYMRWLFMPILFMALATALSIERENVSFKKPLITVGGLMAAMVLFLSFVPVKYNDKWTFGLWNRNIADSKQFYTYLVFMLLSFLSVIFLFDVLRIRRINTKKFTKNSIIYICILVAITQNFTFMVGKSYTFDDNCFISEYTTDLNIDVADGERIDIQSDISNMALAMGYPSVNCFHSVVPGSIYEYYDYLGGSRNNYSNPRCDDYAARAFLSVKYVIKNKTYGKANEVNLDENKNILPSLFDEQKNIVLPGYKKSSEQGDFTIYENKNCLPLGFTTNSYYTKEDTELFSYQKKSQMMLKGVLMSDTQAKKYSLNKLNTESLSFGSEAFLADCNKIKQSSVLKNVKIDKNGNFKGVVFAKDDTFLTISVPYEKGWTAFVNGKETNIEKINAGFMGIELTQGINNVKFEYCAPGLKTGCILSVLGFACLIAYVFICKKKKLTI